MTDDNIGVLGYQQALKQDPDLGRWLVEEQQRQEWTLELIASENFASPAVLAAMATPLTNKYAEGYPGRRYYGGCRYVDEVEDLARSRARELFDSDHANVQPHSGSQANMAVYYAALEPGDTILSMDLSHGGHLTHGSSVSFSGTWYDIVSYGVSPESETIDYDQVRRKAQKADPDLIVAGASAYPREIDFGRFRAIADETGAELLVDMAHIAGLVAADLHPTPVGTAQYVTSTTHKTLRGPRGGLILTGEDQARPVDRAIFPGIQGGPLLHVIAAKALCFHEADTEAFRQYQRRIIDGAEALAASLQETGLRVVSGGTDTHLLLVDLTETGVTGKEAEDGLEEAGITVNKNMIPFDERPPTVASGIRLGTPALATRGMDDEAMRTVGTLIAEGIERLAGDADLEGLRDRVQQLCEAYPLYRSGGPFGDPGAVGG